MIEHLVIPEHVLTVEHVMYVSLGLLIGALLSLLFIPLAYGHGTHLTRRRIEAAVPLVSGELRAEKDQLRAQFAMALRRLELTVEHTKARATAERANVGRRTAAFSELNQALAEQTATLLTLESRDRALREKLDATAHELAVASASLRESERALAAKDDELGKLVAEASNRAAEADTRRLETAALRNELDAALLALADRKKTAKEAEERLARERANLAAANSLLEETQAKLVGTAARSTELERQLVALTKDKAAFGQRVAELQAKIDEQNRTLERRQLQIERLRAELEMTRRSPDSARRSSPIAALLAATVPLSET